MPEPNAQNRAQMLCKKATSLQAKSEMLRQEAGELCFESKRLRKKIASLAHEMHDLRDTNFRFASAHNLTNVKSQTNPDEIDRSDGVFRRELLRIRTPGFNRNATRKIIETKI